MGSTPSKSTDVTNPTQVLYAKNYHHFPTASWRLSFLSSRGPRNDLIDLSCSNTRRRLCSKKKVLILGLDGVGKTDLFRRLVSEDTEAEKIASLSRPTLGYNVETIKIRCHHLYHRQYHKVTLWDCGGELPVRTLWPYHYSNTSLLFWVINIHDRLRLDTNLHLLSQILTEPSLSRVPVLIVLYNISFERPEEEESDEDTKQSFLTNLEVAFRFLATLSTSRASAFKWQVINVTFDERNDSQTDLKKIRQCFEELMEL